MTLTDEDYNVTDFCCSRHFPAITAAPPPGVVTSREFVFQYSLFYATAHPSGEGEACRDLANQLSQSITGTCLVSFPGGAGGERAGNERPTREPCLPEARSNIIRYADKKKHNNRPEHLSNCVRYEKSIDAGTTMTKINSVTR